ncbi:hypothetical protein CPB84DRAFT_1914865 [Gymnopilus junonius]|uniref:DUF676 domain-containing protein n=1 Tax=Gymnopilus junonius TaxID=109634 RepID=A0A9P5N9D9_GYMJU|nr:hypothetical protein CPB84DRAFT_1914865 [Gymnopilus junonius]
MTTLVHLIYIHGFQGNDTTFQSFPKHLQEYLEARIPQHVDIKIQSSLYPTYKSIKPISNATKNFLEWLSTQPPGPVILLGHSMGGLLAADAATDPSNNPDRYRPKRIVGVIAFDTPYLGMHPHVVITGIASLLPKGDAASVQKKTKSEGAMNQHPQINVVDEKVTDDWEAFKKEGNIHTRTAPYPSTPQSAASHSTLSVASTFSTISTMSSNLTALTGASYSRSTSSSQSSNHTKRFVDHTLAFFAAKSDDKFAKWLRKHSDEPFSAATRWVVEHFQFGICMFDPPGLKSRYSRLVDWEAGGGLWVNYWTTTVPRTQRTHHDHAHQTHAQNVSDVEWTSVERLDNDDALRANGILSTHEIDSLGHSAALGTPSVGNQQLESPQKIFDEEAKEANREKKSARKSKAHRHFVVLPNGLGSVLGGIDKWENVPIAGVEDEVSAHTGLFIPEYNLDYESLVAKVANRVLGWCQCIERQVNFRT